MLGSELSVLLVEDNPVDQGRIAELLSRTVRCRARLITLSSLTAAKECLTDNDLDAILLDWFLPDHHGVASLRELQAVAPRTPVLMLVGWDDDEGAMAAIRAGAQDVLMKETLSTAILERSLRHAVERKRTESALRQTEEMYRSLIESLPINVFRKDEQSRFVFANQRFCESVHRSLEELVGHTDFAFFPASLAEKYRQDDLKVMRRRRVFETIEDHSTPDGRRIHVQVMKAPATDSRGSVVGTQSMFWDVTDRVEAEEALLRSNARFRKLFDANIIGIILADLSGRILEANDGFLNLVGYSREDLINGTLRWDSITPPEFHELDVLAVDRLRHTGVCPPWEKEYFHKDGSRVPIMVGVSMLDDSSNECICFVLDMTEQRRTREQLRRAKEEADAANQAKSLFLANMSHEIRTPMNAIIGLTELVLDSSLTAQQRDHLTAVAESAELLLSLINHILDFSKIEAGKLELDEVEFSLRTMLAGTMKTLALAAHRKGLELVCDVDPSVPDRLFGDVVRLRQVVLNLLGNAIKFTEIGEVVLRVRLLQREGKSLELQFDVHDTGIGIPEDRQHAIFEAFEQVHKSINRRYGGTGLGLSITAKLASLMGGRVWLKSELGHGSTFFVTCRLQSIEPTTVPAVPNDSPLNGLRVLIVDDNATSRLHLASLLKSWNMQPVVAASAKEAVAQLEVVGGLDQGHGFAFSLIDSLMPGTDGFELASLIMSGLAERAGQLVMLLCSPDRRSELIRCEQLSLLASVAKPINESELLDTLMSLRLGSGLTTLPQVPERVSSLARVSLNVLLVEDSLYNQKLAIALLQKRGHHVTIANHGREAVETTLRQSFDRVLMDVQMPEMDGLEATRLIRDREARLGVHVPIIAMTAQALTGDRERCLAAGMDAYLTKPIRSDQLFETLEADFPNAVFPKGHPKPKAIKSETSKPHAADGANLLTTKSPPSANASPSVLNRPNGHKPNSGLVNWSQAMSIVGGDSKLLRDVVSACLDDFPKWVRDFDRGLSNQDAVTFRRAAHSLRGACRTFGLERIAPQAEELESLAVVGHLTAAAQLLETIRPDLGTCVAEMQEYLVKS